MVASRAASMFPPETTQTSLRPGTRPDSAAATASAPAPSAITRARSASSRTAAAVSSSDDDVRAGEQRPGPLPHRRQHDLRRRRRRRTTARIDLRRLARRHDAGDGGAGLRLDRVRPRARAAAPRSALAIPVKSPPPPHGTSTASTSGESSASSSPIVPLPAITRSSCDRVHEQPVEPVVARRSIDPPPRSNGTFTTVPPSRSIGVELRLRARGRATTTVPGRRARRATHATPCAMLPALAVHDAARQLSRGAPGGSRSTAPRILNEPIGCRFSSLSQISAGASTCSRTSGVRSATPAIVSRAPLDLGERDQKSTSVPTPSLARACARRARRPRDPRRRGRAT